MAELLITEVEDTILRGLQERASAHGRSAEAEARDILVEALQAKKHAAWAQINAFCDRLAASGRTFSDSTELIREDRDR